MVKKIFGYFFIITASFLILSLLVNLVKILGAFLRIFKIFSGTMTADEIGYTFGYLLPWVLFIALIVVLIRVGMKWIRKPKKIVDGDHLPLDSNFNVE